MQKADIWSCGIILYAMLFGKHPFDVEDKLFIRKLVLARYHLPPVRATAIVREWIRPGWQLFSGNLRAHGQHMPAGVNEALPLALLKALLAGHIISWQAVSFACNSLVEALASRLDGHWPGRT